MFLRPNFASDDIFVFVKLSVKSLNGGVCRGGVTKVTWRGLVPSIA